MPRLGTRDNPAVVRVATQEKARAIIDLCNEHGWIVIAGIEPDKAENVGDIELLMNQPKPYRAGPPIGRNDPCPCGSGTKFKKCCGA